MTTDQKAKAIIHDRIRGHISAYRIGEQDYSYTVQCVRYYRDAFSGSPQIYFWAYERARVGLK